MGVFDKIFAHLAAGEGIPEQLQIDATHLKAHRTAASLLKKGMFPVVSTDERTQNSTLFAMAWADPVAVVGRADE